MLEKEGLSCLIVDDDSMILSLVRQFLQPMGYTCSIASSAESALELLEGKSFSLMITDLLMGGMDGLALTKHVKKLHPAMPIIVMTGFIDDHSYDEAIEAGAADFLKKPFTMNEIKTRVTRVMRDAQFIDVLKKKEKAMEEISTMMIAGLQDEAQKKLVLLEAEIARLKKAILIGKTD